MAYFLENAVRVGEAGISGEALSPCFMLQQVSPEVALSCKACKDPGLGIRNIGRRW